MQSYDTVDPPSHVPAEHIVAFDYLHPDDIEHRDIYLVLKRLHDKPDIL
jgi:hypothetical protein